MPSNNILRLRITIYNPGMNNNNNNNNQTPLMLMRDRLFQFIFMRFSIAYATAIPNVVRKILENLILFFAFLSLFVLAYTHAMFIYRPMNCLDSVIEDWPRQGILRIEINQRAQNESYTLKDSYLKEAQIRQMQGYEIPNIKNEDSSTKMPDSESSSSSDPEVLSDSARFDPKSVTSEIEDAVDQSFSKEALDDDENAGHFLAAEGSSQHLSTMYSNPNHSSIADGDALSKTWYKVLKTLKDEEIYDIQEVAFYEDVYILEYSLEYGYLRLSPKAREKLNIPVMLVSLDPNVDECFGNWFAKMVMKHFLGYNNILMASIRKLADKEENKGFIRNVVHDHYFRFVNIMNHLSYAYAALIMLVFTLSISMLLRYSHQQIFFFIVHVLRLFEFRGSTSVPTASLLTVILALVGMEAIMSEFFSDPTTSFYVILIVWVADQYDAICCRTIVAKRHWLRFFYLYHYAFYAYDYRFSGQYSDLALFTSCCFIFHSMVFFFHHYELPAILRAVHHDAQQQRTEQEQIPPGRPDEEPRGNEDPNPIQEEPGAPDPTNESTADNQSTSDSGDVENDSSFVESQSRLESCSSEGVADDFFSKKLEPHDDNKSSQKTLKGSDFDCVDCGGGKLNVRSGTVSDSLSALRLKDNDLILKKPGETCNGVDDSFTSTSSSVPTLCQNKMAPTFSSPRSTDKNSSLVTCRGDPANL